MASFGDKARGQASGQDHIGEPTERGLADKSIGAKIEFEVWRSTFQRSHASWANAPAELRPMMLLTGPALVRAESWLMNFPDKLSVSERRFVKQSLAEKSADEDVAFGQGPETLSIVGGMWVVAFAVVVSMFGPFLPGLLQQALMFALPAEVRDVIRQDQASLPKAAVPVSRQKPAVQPTEQAQDGRPDEDGMVVSVLHGPAGGARNGPVLTAQQLMQRAHLRLEQKDTRGALLLAVEAAHLNDRDGVKHQPSRDLVSAASLVVQGLTQQVGAGPQPAISPTSAPVLFCDGGRVWVAAGADGTLQVFRAGLSTSLKALPRRGSPLQGVSFSPDCKMLAVPGEDYSVGLWSTQTGQRSAEMFGHTGSLLATVFRADGGRLVSASQDGSARLWDARTGRLVAALEEHDRDVVSAAFSPDGQRVVTGSKDGTLRIWTVGSNAGSITLAGHSGGVTNGQFSPDGTHVLSTSIDGFAALWDSTTGEKLRQIESEGTAILTAEFSPDGRRIVTMTQDGFVQVWDLARGQVLAALDTGKEHTRRVAFAPDGSRLLTTSWQGQSKLFDAYDGQLIAHLNGDQDRVEAAVFASEGERAVALLSQGTMVSWPIYATPFDAIAAAKVHAGACFTRAERDVLALSVEAPAWCAQDLQP